MKVLSISDLHCEFHSDGGEFFIEALPPADILVLAGDLNTFDGLENNIYQICSNYPHVVYVAGNHEYYNSTFSKVDKLLDKLSNKINNFHYLENNLVCIKTLTFVGATLWYPKNQNTLSNKTDINDFTYIKKCDPEAFNRYEKTIKYLENNIANNIVVTHHMPSFECVASEYKKDKLNCYFAVNLDQMILEKKPKIWICGHTHQSFYRLLGDTKIICNPVGYPREHKTYSIQLLEF